MVEPAAFKASLDPNPSAVVMQAMRVVVNLDCKHQGGTRVSAQSCKVRQRTTTLKLTAVGDKIRCMARSILWRNEFGQLVEGSEEWFVARANSYTDPKKNVGHE